MLLSALAFIVLLRSTVSQIKQVDVQELTVVVAGLFDESAEVENKAFNNSLTRSHGDVLLRPVIRTQYSVNSFNIWKTACTVEARPVAVFGPQVVAVDAALREVTAAAHIPHLQATWQPPEPEVDPELDPCSSMEEACSEESLERDSRCCFVSLNLYPDAEEISQAVANILLEYGWTGFTILYEDKFGLMRVQKMLSTFINFPKAGKFPLTVRKLTAGKNNQAIFKELENMHESRVLLDCHVDRIIPYLTEAAESDMLNIYQSYILTSLEAHSISQQLVDMAELKANISWLSMFEIEDRRIINDPLKNKASYWYKDDFNTTSIRLETLLVADAVTHLSKATSELKEDLQMEDNRPPTICRKNMEEPWGLGAKFQKTLLEVQSQGYSGNIQFDKRGKRVNYRLYLHQMLNGDDPNTLVTWESTSMAFNESTKRETDAANQISSTKSKKFYIMSKIAKPYFSIRTDKDETLTGNDRYEGYSVDLITEIFKIMKSQSPSTDYTFEFVLPTEDQNKPGTYDPITKQWDGLVGALLSKKADLAVCDLTITEERKGVIDFSVPFMTTGISILFLKEIPDEINIFAFLKPFSVEVWIYTATAYLVVSIVLYVSSRISPGDWENPQPCEKEPDELENIWNFKNCTWLTMGSIMTQGCDILPKAVGSRWVTGMWWFFAMIVCQTYIAQLAASLTSALAEEPIKSVEDLANTKKISYGCLEGGSTAQFFARSKDKMFERMWLTMNTSRPSPMCATNEDGAHRVLKGGNKYAFFMEATAIEYLTKRNCELIQVGNLLDSKDYGIAMPANSPFRSKINEAILDMQASGLINNIKKKWWEEKYDAKNCLEPDKNDQKGDLEMPNLIGAFLVLGVGCAISVVIAAFEFLDHIRNVVISERISHKEAFVLEMKSSLNLFQLKKPVLGKSSPQSTHQGSLQSDQETQPRPMVNAAAAFINLEKMF